ncbi:MAG TPA: hypothetical protein VKE22_27165 [Haliangiales bacterium]|nr:hypothetical protein [Haliangiales bacterium]
MQRDDHLVDPEEHDGHLDGCADCRQRREEYARLAQAIAGGQTSHRLPAGFKERAVSRMHAVVAARSRRRRYALGVAATVAAAAALVVVLVRRHDLPPAALTVSVVEGTGEWRGNVHPGAEIRASAVAPGHAWYELRIYREAREILLRCPGASEPACRRVEAGVEVRWHIPSVGDYQLVWLVGRSSPPPATGSLDADIRAATEVGGRAVATEFLHVL